jgi:hypothetical protein
VVQVCLGSPIKHPRQLTGLALTLKTRALLASANLIAFRHSGPAEEGRSQNL